jgi:heme/copper-type cytochrome/quinol oxidase subunit 2
VLVTTIGYIASAAVVLVAISFLQRERVRSREEQRPQNGRLRAVWIAVMFAGLIALLYFTIQR